MARARAASLWVVTRVAVYASAWNAEPRFYPDDGDSPAGLPLEAFPDKKVAEAAQKQLERLARETAPIGPFLPSLLPEGLSAIAVAAKAAGLPLPDYTALAPAAKPGTGGNSTTVATEHYEYRQLAERIVDAWWALVAADITPGANAVLWEKLFPNFHFYTVGRVLFEG
jgi:hypothetical protein